MKAETSKPDPGVILDLIVAFRRSKTMFAAVAMGVFDALEPGPKSLEEMSETLRVDPEMLELDRDAIGPRKKSLDLAPGGLPNLDALERLLDACVGLELLTYHDGLYRNTPVAATYLCSGSESRMTGYINYSNKIFWRLWGNLEGAIMQGTDRWKQTYGWEGPIFESIFRNENDKEEFLRGMHGYGLITSPHVITACDQLIGLGGFETLVDLGGGTGHLVMEACRRFPNLQGVIFELAEATPFARRIIGENDMADRIDVREGNFFVDDLPGGDLYALARTLHDWEEEEVLQIAEPGFRAATPRGLPLIAEKLLAEDKSGPGWAQMQNLNMLTCRGKERTFRQYESLLLQAGFKRVMGKPRHRLWM